MLSIPVAIVILILNLAFAEEKDAREAAREACADAQVARVEDHFARVEDHFEFECGQTRYVVRCGDGGCRVARP